MKHEIMYIKNELNFWERILFRIFKKTFVNIYKAGIKTGFNWRREHT